VKFCTSPDGQHREDTPDQDHDPDELLRAPPLGQMTARYLQEQVTDEEDATGQALLGLVDVQVVAHPGERETDVRPVHERDDVDDDRDRDQAGPPAVTDAGAFACDGCHDYRTLLGRNAALPRLSAAVWGLSVFG
jgi:hypothetical protein